MTGKGKGKGGDRRGRGKKILRRKIWVDNRKVTSILLGFGVSPVSFIIRGQHDEISPGLWSLITL